MALHAAAVLHKRHSVDNDIIADFTPAFTIAIFPIKQPLPTFAKGETIAEESQTEAKSAPISLSLSNQIFRFWIASDGPMKKLKFSGWGMVFQAMGKDRVAKMFLFVGALIQKALKVILLWVKRIEHRFA